MKNLGMDGRKQYTPMLPPSKAGHEFHDLTWINSARFVTIRVFVS